MANITPTNEPFGFLLALDLYDCKPGVCNDFALCYRFLEDLIVKLRMEKQSHPYLFRSDGKKYPDKAGLSGWIALIESGIQIHTLIPRNFITIDIYSCRRFDPKSIEAFVQSYFEPQEIEAKFIERGTRYHE